jgi:hypothetical protein
LPDRRAFGFQAGDSVTSQPAENYADGNAETIERERHHVDSSDARPVPVERIGNGRDGPRGAGSTGTLGVLKEALGHLEWACSAIVAESTAAADTAKKRVADVKSEAEAGALRARLEAQTEIADLRSMVDRLRIDVQTVRDRFQVTDEPFDPGRAEKPPRDAPLKPFLSAASYGSQLLALREELEASRAECSDLARQLDVEKANRTRLMAGAQAIPDPSTAATPSAAQHVTGGLHFDPPEYARQLLDNIEAVYAADVASGLMPDDLVARLAANLTYGAEVFARRLGSAAGPGTSVFDEQLMIVLQTRGEVSFGRHLAVAAYGFERPRK